MRVQTSSIFLVLLLAFHPATAFTGTPAVKIRMQDVVVKVSQENLEVYQNALKVYQAQKSVSVARANLLPKLNFWRIISIPFDPRALVGMVGDIAPFLIPSNWFQLEAEKKMYSAQVEAYRALWANEVMTAKGLYYHMLYDQNLLSHIEDNKKALKKLSSIIRTHETLGGAPQGASREVEVRLLALEEDARALQVLVEEEESTLSYMMGYGSTGQIELEPLPLPNYSQIKAPVYEELEARVLEKSPELRQYDYIVEASKSVKKSAYFSLFGITNESRGVAGGIFDNVPIQDGLGFGLPASIEISKSQTEMLKLQRQGAEETLKRQLRLLIASYNIDLQNYPGLERRVELTKAINSQLYNRMRLGEDIDLLTLIEASRNHVQANTALYSAKFRFLMSDDKASRLLFNGDYANEPAKIETLRARIKP